MWGPMGQKIGGTSSSESQHNEEGKLQPPPLAAHQKKIITAETNLFDSLLLGDGHLGPPDWGCIGPMNEQFCSLPTFRDPYTLKSS